MSLTLAQQEAVAHAGDLALASCPGSGKTRTLVAKILVALADVRDSTRSVGCITYTNSAVNEIEHRLSRLEPSVVRSCEVETIHSFCIKHVVAPHSWHLRGFADGFTIVSPEDERFQGIVERVGARFSLPRRARDGFEQLARGTGVCPEGLSVAHAQAFWGELDAQGLMDFSGIVFWAAELLRNKPYIARGLASRFQWLLVDEFQDTSSLQVSILRAIHSYGRTRFFLIGDPLQSIMSFAGARPELLNQFGIELEARRDIQLLDNYRSSARILALADRLCPRAAPMVARGLSKDFKYDPQWIAAPSMLEGIVRSFLPHARACGIPLSEVAILSNRWTSLLPLSRGLRGHSIPALGPGARPYKRSNHVIAPLLEELAARASENDQRRLLHVRREIRRLLQSVRRGVVPDLGFAGDVSAVRLTRLAASLAATEERAAHFLLKMAEAVSLEMAQLNLVTRTEVDVIKASGAAMVADIARHETQYKIRTTTVRDLGLFAKGGECARLLTMHAAKGKEFDAVALVDVFDGHVPFYTAKPGDDVEAEGRRLLYVALTRARKLLMVITLAEPGDKTQPSRFLASLFPGGPQHVG